jgi:hypothetical protein
MGGRECARDLEDDRHDVGDRLGPFPASPGAERLALDQLHDEKRDALRVADVVHRADLRVVQARDDARLAVEPLAESRIGGQYGRQHLERHRSIEPRVPPAVHVAHTACAEQTGDFVGAEEHAGSERHLAEQCS